ncbi:MAG: hypothetical protein ABI673_10070 [Novosphingobium sp.]
MIVTRSRMRSIGWAVILAVCGALTLALTFRVNAVKSQVRLAERQIVRAEQDKSLLETEFETRANQQQLTALNQVEFGYQAPTAQQYLENERQLAALSKPRSVDAPEPIMVATANDRPEKSALVAMVNPLTGSAMAAEVPAGGARRGTGSAGLGDRLSGNDRLSAPVAGKKVAVE